MFLARDDRRFNESAISTGSEREKRGEEVENGPQEQALELSSGKTREEADVVWAFIRHSAMIGYESPAEIKMGAGSNTSRRKK